jgi:CHASE2 domain-containing sensor protein
MSNENNNDQYLAALREWVGAESVDLIQQAPTHRDWNADIVEQATANMSAARTIWAKEVRRRRRKAMLAWTMVSIMILSLVTAFMSAWISAVGSMLFLLGAVGATLASTVLYHRERRYHDH